MTVSKKYGKAQEIKCTEGGSGRKVTEKTRLEEEKQKRRPQAGIEFGERHMKEAGSTLFKHKVR